MMGWRAALPAALRAVQVAAGFVLLLTIPACMDKPTAGLYFAIASLFGLWNLVDLGQSNLVAVVITHAPPAAAGGLVAGYRRKALFRAALALLLVPLVALAYFRHIDQGLQPVVALLAGASAAYFILATYETCILEGLGRPVLANALRNGQLAAQALGSVAVIATTGQAWSFLASSLLCSALGHVIARRCIARSGFSTGETGAEAGSAAGAEPSPPTPHKTPPVTATAITAVFSYLSFGSLGALFTLVLGPSEGGRIALAFAGLSSLASIGIAQLVARRRGWAQLAAAGSHVELRRRVLADGRLTVLLVAGTMVAATLGLLVAHAIPPLAFLAGRLPDGAAIAAVAGAITVQCVATVAGGWSRSYLEERLVPVSIVQGIATAALTALGGYAFGTTGAAVGLLLSFALACALILARCHSQYREYLGRSGR